MKKKIITLCASLLMASMLLIPSIANGLSDVKCQAAKTSVNYVVMFGGGHDVDIPW
ncbi:hypothetical protein M5X06_16960 [Paenibacillus alvei]|uniref:Uncharacterized protein n=1 Tax=Paenibacillus alvei TaxID=44250 RepID=A0ABT4H0G9_PAEAL|nr:hypothetical protein [Paenibacillus alvei]MCY9582043.1 hypothetical protein [Paenibacillus alvei]MCY9587726.1 hypothetical protein [Paenibacillus alvei]MCY9762419.1 hypothetical protein [Paenibacillus alvei]MCY9768495.1 hypothetical protein [Paenibacillus alvei]NEZ43768.1 hypothetical protein [Paenibacillus alvei]